MACFNFFLTFEKLKHFDWILLIEMDTNTFLKELIGPRAQLPGWWSIMGTAASLLMWLQLLRVAQAHTSQSRPSPTLLQPYFLKSELHSTSFFYMFTFLRTIFEKLFFPRWILSKNPLSINVKVTSYFLKWLKISMQRSRS